METPHMFDKGKTDNLNTFKGSEMMTENVASHNRIITLLREQDEFDYFPDMDDFHYKQVPYKLTEVSEDHKDTPSMMGLLCLYIEQIHTKTKLPSITDNKILVELFTHAYHASVYRNKVAKDVLCYCVRCNVFCTMNVNKHPHKNAIALKIPKKWPNIPETNFKHIVNPFLVAIGIVEDIGFNRKVACLIKDTDGWCEFESTSFSAPEKKALIPYIYKPYDTSLKPTPVDNMLDKFKMPSEIVPRPGGPQRQMNFDEMLNDTNMMNTVISVGEMKLLQHIRSRYLTANMALDRIQSYESRGLGLGMPNQNQSMLKIRELEKEMDILKRENNSYRELLKLDAERRSNNSHYMNTSSDLFRNNSGYRGF